MITPEKALIRSIKQYLTMLENNGVVTNVYGRRRRFYKDKSATEYTPKQLREAINFTVQGTVGDTLSVAVTNLRQRIRDQKLDIKILLPIHDAIICMCRDDRREECINTMRESMSVNIPKIDLVLNTDTEVMPRYWGDS